MLAVRRRSAIRAPVVVVVAVAVAIAAAGCGGAMHAASSSRGGRGTPSIAQTVARMHLPARERAAMLRAMRAVRGIHLRNCPSAAQRARVTALMRAAAGPEVAVSPMFLCRRHRGG